MKYFTKEWCFSNLDDSEIDKISRSYRDYINTIHPKLPFALKILAKNMYLHDGKITKVTIVKEENTLILNGVFGDLQTGYYFLEIKYLKTSNINTKELILLFKDQEIEVLNDEIELLSNTLFSHKFFFSSNKEIDILFEDIIITISNADPKHYRKSQCLFESQLKT